MTQQKLVLTNFQPQPRVLIVDDEEDIRKNHTSIVASMGYDLDVAFDGLECLEKLKTSKFGLVIMGIKMPRMDGVEALKRIGEAHEGLPVIIVSAIIGENLEKTLKENGAFAVFRKPVDIPILESAIEQAIKASNAKKPSGATESRLKALPRLVFAALFALAFWLLQRSQNGDENTYMIIAKWVLFYFAISIFLNIFEKYKVVKPFLFVLSIPTGILIILDPIIHSLAAIFFAYIATMIAVFVITVGLPAKLWGISFEDEAILFIVLTTTSIIVTAFGDKIIKKWHDFQDSEDKEFHHKLSMLLLNQKKSRIIIFLIYFISLLVFNALHLNESHFFENENLASAVLQSFATYVAFDRLQSNWVSAFKKQ